MQTLKQVALTGNMNKMPKNIEELSTEDREEQLIKGKIVGVGSERYTRVSYNWFANIPIIKGIRQKLFERSVSKKARVYGADAFYQTFDIPSLIDGSDLETIVTFYARIN